MSEILLSYDIVLTVKTKFSDVVLKTFHPSNAPVMKQKKIKIKLVDKVKNQIPPATLYVGRVSNKNVKDLLDIYFFVKTFS